MEITQKLLSLKESPQHRTAFYKLVDQVFPAGSPVSKPCSVDREFALLLNSNNAQRNLFIVDTEDSSVKSLAPIIAAASYRVFEFSIPGLKDPLKCAGIGLVVTHADHQRKGLGHFLQAEIERRAADEGAVVSVLWSNLVQFYTRLGYVLAGAEWQWQLDRSELDFLRSRLAAEVQPSALVAQPFDDFSSVLTIYEKAKLGPARDFALYSELLGLPNTYAYRTNNSYGIMGKGRDLRDTLHELNGPPADVAPLLHALIAHNESGLRVMQPLASNLKDELEHWLGPAKKEAMAFIKVLSGKSLAAWVTQSQILPPGISLSASESGFSLRSGLASFFQSADFGHLIQLFFGPWSIGEMQNLPLPLTENLTLESKFMPVYFWGFDSV